MYSQTCVKGPYKVAVTPGTDKKSSHPFASGRIRFVSVPSPVNPFLVR